MMDAVVLAGGLGTRLRPVIADVPKPMAPVAGRPFLEILLASLADQGIPHTVLSVGYLAEKIMDHFGGSYAGMALSYAVEPQPLGTGGAVRQSLARCRSDHAVILNGDTYLDVRFAELEARWQTSRTPIIVGRQVADGSRYGVLEVVDGVVAAFGALGPPGPALINAGCYVLPVDALNGFPAGVAFSLERDFLGSAVLRQLFQLYLCEGRFIDIGVPEDYALAQTVFAGG